MSLWLLPLIFAHGSTPTHFAPTIERISMASLEDAGAKVGIPERLGDKGSELQFTLDSAAIASRYPAPEDTIIAITKERLLVLTFTVTNPVAREQRAAPGSFNFLVQGSAPQPYEGRGYFYHPAKHTRYETFLKLGQKVQFVTIVPIYAEGPVTNLKIRRGAKSSVQYNLSNSTVKSTSTFSPDGISLTAEAAVKMNETFDCAGFDMTIFDSGIAREIGPIKAPAGKQLIYFSVRYKNALLRPNPLGFQIVTPTLLDASGQSISWTSEIISDATNKDLYQDLAPGETVSGKYVFVGPTGVRPQTLRLLMNPSGRTAVLTLGGTAEH